MSGLKVGDRVRIIDTDYCTQEDGNLANGQTGRVIEVLDGAVLIQTDAGPRNMNGDEGWCFCDEQVELIQADEQPTSHSAGVSNG